MDDMSNKNTDNWKAYVDALIDSKGKDIQVLDVAEHCSWANYMILVTGTSQVHIRGLYGKIKETCKDLDGIGPLNHPKTGDDNNWILVDCGGVVVQIQTQEAREFYEIDKLWAKAPTIFEQEVEA